MKKYFEQCSTNEEVKARFRDLAKQLHPDCGGDAASFREMMEEYRTAFERFKDLHRNMEGETYKKTCNESAEQFADLINRMMGFQNVVIEIIGSWIWVSGNTKPYRDQFMEMGFFWSAKKVAWYYTGEEREAHKKRRGHYSMDGLRKHWGSQKVEPDSPKGIE